MMQLVAVVVMMAVFFAIIGYLRGWNRELIATAGIILALFGLFQFDSTLRGTLLVNVARDQVFLIQSLIFGAIVFFAYQTRSFPGRADRPSRRGTAADEGRDSLQNNILGGLIGAINGYLIWGSIWYFMDINEYPLSPFVIAPSPGSPSDQARNILPLVWLAGGIGGNGDLLAAIVIGLFVVILILI